MPERTVPRRELLAYLVGAGVAGTILVAPYVGRPFVIALFPELKPLAFVPFFVLPLFWGVWNWLRFRLGLQIGIGAWGAVLGFGLACLANGLFVAEGVWFPAVLLLLVTLPAGYWLLWTFLVGPLNEGLGVEAGTISYTTPS
jgi:hypothetical protein